MRFVERSFRLSTDNFDMRNANLSLSNLVTVQEPDGYNTKTCALEFYEGQPKILIQVHNHDNEQIIYQFGGVRY
jgi:hypothetical protein